MQLASARRAARRWVGLDPDDGVLPDDELVGLGPES
jgi:hypothetical protein